MNTTLLSGYYTGIGSRETPIDIQQLMTEIAMYLRAEGWTLRTGSGSRADKSYQIAAGENKEVYVPWDNFYPGQVGITSLTEESSRMAHDIWKFREQKGLVPTDGSISGKWEDLHPGTKAMLAKAMCMLLGKNLNTPSDMVICWTPGAKIVGISSHVICLAVFKHIPVFNLAEYETEVIVREMLRRNTSPSEVIENRRQRCESEKAICGISWE